MINFGASRQSVVKKYSSRWVPDGHLLDQEEVMDLRVTMTKAQMELIDRAREVLAAAGKVPSLAQIISKAMEDLLAKLRSLAKGSEICRKKGHVRQCAGARTFAFAFAFAFSCNGHGPRGYQLDSRFSRCCAGAWP